MIDLTEVPGTRARLWLLCREYQRVARTPSEQERARKTLSDLASHQIGEEDFAFITDWAKLDRALARSNLRSHRL